MRDILWGDGNTWDSFKRTKSFIETATLNILYVPTKIQIPAMARAALTFRENSVSVIPELVSTS